MRPSDPREAETDRNGVPYGERLARARAAAGKTPEYVATMLAVPLDVYHEWEAFEGELTVVRSLRELARLSSAVGIPAAALFEDLPPDSAVVTPEQLCSVIRAYLCRTGMSIAKFEERVGFVIAPCLEDPSEVLTWTVDCLRFVCAEVGVDWLSALP